MSFLVKTPKAPTLPPVAAAPSADDPSVIAAEQARIAAEKRRKGRGSTLLTGGSGDTSVAPTAPRTLLGE